MTLHVWKESYTAFCETLSIVHSICKKSFTAITSYVVLGEYNGIRTYNHLVHKQMFDHIKSCSKMWKVQDVFKTELEKKKITSLDYKFHWQGVFELWTSCMRCNYLTTRPRPSGLSNCKVCKRFAIQSLMWSLKGIIWRVTRGVGERGTLTFNVVVNVSKE